MSSSPTNPFLLIAAPLPTDEILQKLLPLLRSDPSLASQQDAHGYSLLHAASSYSHLAILRTLVHDFHVNVNLKDEDGETCLFVAEKVEVVKCLVEELGVDTGVRNDEGMTAAEKIVEEGEWPDVASYIELRGAFDQSASNMANKTGDGAATDPAPSSSHPPPLPPNVRVDVGAMSEAQLNDAGNEPDPEFRRRIEELVNKDNFHGEEGQQELRNLVADALRRVANGDGTVGERNVRVRRE